MPIVQLIKTELMRVKKNIVHATKKTSILTELTFSHGMTREQLKEKQTAQGNRCACCGEWFIETPQIDHDHDCCPAHRSCDKCRRGLLCRDCNFGLGFFKDSPLRLQQAIGYLAKYDREIIKDEGPNA